MDCYCDFDPPEFCSSRIVTASKKHKCYECSAPIMPGEKYEYTVGKWDGLLDTFKVCEDCHDIRQWVKNNIPCFCWYYGNMLEDAEEAVIEACRYAPEETQGVMFGFLRRKVINRRRRAAKKAAEAERAA